MSKHDSASIQNLVSLPCRHVSVQAYDGPMTAEAIRLVARTEGIFLDPVFTGKAMAGMIDLIRKKRIGQGEKVLFLHTGGWPALFA